MSIDFANIMDDESEVVLNPRDILQTLRTRRGHSFLRDIQAEVLDQWFSKRDRRDNIIKLSVGSGKTRVGLLALQSSLNEGKGPALYVAPNPQLTNQILSEADLLGINVTEDPRDSFYSNGDAICVINIYKLFNGKSVFGVGTARIRIGSCVIDDVHASISTVTNQFRIQLNNDHQAYKEIFIKLKEDLRNYNEARYLEVESRVPYTYMEVPFWSWDAHLSTITRVLFNHRNDEDLEFTYPLLRDILRQCRCFIGGTHLEIEPYFPPTDIIQAFRRSYRRIYMTATLSDDTPIVTHFGADPDCLGKPIVPSLSQALGERMILMPQQLNPDFTMKDIYDLLTDLAREQNVVAIVPSHAAADRWDQVAQSVSYGNDVGKTIEKLRRGHVGLTVLINRYDGIDLPNEACRVLVIAGLPEVSSFSDATDSEILGNSPVLLRRQIERIEQGMGRGIRSNEDYCVVILLDPRLTGRLCLPEASEMLTSATRAQLQTSQTIARRLPKPSIQQVRSVIQQCLNRDQSWINYSKKSLLNLKCQDELRLDESRIALYRAVESARAHRDSEGIAVLDEAISRTQDSQIKAWLLSRKAAHLHAADAVGAQQALIAAHRLEPSILRPLNGIEYRQVVTQSNEQAITLVERHRRRFDHPTRMQLFANALCTDLRFGHSTSRQFESAMNDLAWFLGIQGQRPEKDYKEGPDNLWAVSGRQFFVIECKNRATTDSGIAKRDVAQLGQSVEWFRRRYPSSQCIPIVVHPKRTLGLGANPVQGMRIIDRKRLKKLRKRITKFARQLANPDVSQSVPEVRKRLTQFELHSNVFVHAFGGRPKF